MTGQGLIVGVGAIDYPAAFGGADPQTLAGWGLSKTVVLSSTYDHRIIQGARSGNFLATVHDLLMGGHDFYRDVFRDLGVPLQGGRVAPRRDGDRLRRGHDPQAVPGGRPYRQSPRPGPPDRRSGPAGTQGARPARRPGPGRPRSHHLGPRPGVPRRRSRWSRRRGRRAGAASAAGDPARPTRRLLPNRRRGLHAHPRPRRETLAPGAGGGPPDRPEQRGEEAHPSTG